jgi:co-chaperonin GroES (HSP10)
MQKIEMCNNTIMVKELLREKEEEKTEGLYIPKDNLEDEQVAQGVVVNSASEQFKEGDIVLFHKVLPVDVNMKLDGDDGLKKYFFILARDIICKIIK